MKHLSINYCSCFWFGGSGYKLQYLLNYLDGKQREKLKSSELNLFLYLISDEHFEYLKNYTQHFIKMLLKGLSWLFFKPEVTLTNTLTFIQLWDSMVEKGKAN